jgi:hypothetical protein
VAVLDRRRRTRREFLKFAGLSAAAVLPFRPALAQGAAGRVVVIGGGFGGASCARALARLDPRIAVTLVEPNATFTACPFSNLVVAGLRQLPDQQFSYEMVAKSGIGLAQLAANGVDPQTRTVTLADGTRLVYERLVVAPGIDIRWDALAGYGAAAAEQMPHAGRPASRPRCCGVSFKQWRMAVSSSCRRRPTRSAARRGRTNAPA